MHTLHTLQELNKLHIYCTQSTYPKHYTVDWLNHCFHWQTGHIGHTDIILHTEQANLKAVEFFSGRSNIIQWLVTIDWSNLFPIFKASGVCFFPVWSFVPSQIALHPSVHENSGSEYSGPIAGWCIVIFCIEPNCIVHLSKSVYSASIAACCTVFL